MGAIITGLATFLGGALAAVVGWVATALTSAALVNFWTFAAKIAMLLAISAIVINFVTPFASSLAIDVLPVHARWVADQIAFAYCFSVIISAFVFRWALGWIKAIL